MGLSFGSIPLLLTPRRDYQGTIQHQKTRPCPHYQHPTPSRQHPTPTSHLYIAPQSLHEKCMETEPLAIFSKLLETTAATSQKLITSWFSTVLTYSSVPTPAASTHEILAAFCNEGPPNSAAAGEMLPNFHSSNVYTPKYGHGSKPKSYPQ